MAANPVAELNAADVFSPGARATLDRARDQFVLHLASPVLRHEQALSQGAFPFRANQHDVPQWDFSAVVKYPVLTDAIATLNHDWHRANAKLAARFASDFPHQRIEAIAPFHSDPHDGQQAVAMLRLSDGRALVYKPRSLEMEEAFGDLLAWTNARGFPWPFRRVKVFPRGTYGWMECVASAPCRTEGAVDAFYARAGGLLCLLALLQATDIHHENLVAAGDQPAIIDLETIGHPRPERISFAQALLETGLLPNGDSLDFSALGATEAFDTPFDHRVPLRDNVAMFDGRKHTAAMHVSAVARGFAAMFRLLLNHDARPFVRRFEGRRVRVIRRASNDYGLLLQASRQPRYMRDATLRRQLFERLRNVSEEELAALERFDVPCFTTRCDTAPLLAAYEQLSLAQLPALLTTIHHALNQRRSTWRTNPRSDRS